MNEGPLGGPSFEWWICRRSTPRSAQAAASVAGSAGAALAAAPLARVRPPPLERLGVLVPRRPPERGWVLELANEEAAVAAAAASPVPAPLDEPFGPAW
jgi:hypothetical protein